ncbi:MAG TPA: MFS transporter [Chitinophagaceae bacterium]|nr:MFS transporter [Chitinophagaceae bacterium]
MKIINRTVWILSLVSLFADIASEMLYPVIPVYLKEIGFSIVLIGVLEGVAEATAGLSKGYFGKRSDISGLRLPYIKGGYLLSSLSKPMMGFFTLPLWIFFARTIDRLGKGLRTAARDALLSQNATPETKGRVFSFHRGMDTTGAIIGPLFTLLYLHFFPHDYTNLFYLAFLPGLLAIALVFLLKEKKRVEPAPSSTSFFSYIKYWQIASPQYKKLVTGLLVFALFNSSDVFLLLKTKEITGSDTITILAYIFYNFVYAIAAYPMGVLGDKWGFKSVFVAGLLIFSGVYLLFGLTHSSLLLFIAFFLYGIYGAATEGIAKAWITNTAKEENMATAIGFYTSCQSICTLAASTLAGLLWSSINSSVTFIVTALISVLLVFYFRSFTYTTAQPN